MQRPRAILDARSVSRDRTGDWLTLKAHANICTTADAVTPFYSPRCRVVNIPRCRIQINLIWQKCWRYCIGCWFKQRMVPDKPVQHFIQHHATILYPTTLHWFGHSAARCCMMLKNVEKSCTKFNLDQSVLYAVSIVHKLPQRIQFFFFARKTHWRLSCLQRWRLRLRSIPSFPWQEQLLISWSWRKPNKHTNYNISKLSYEF